MDVGGTLSEIFLPAWDKKELNSSAIAVGSEIVEVEVVKMGIFGDLVWRELEVGSLRGS
jgi:hypothetical protein